MNYESGNPGSTSNNVGGLEGVHIISLHAGYQARGIYTDAFLARPADGVPRPGVVLLSGMFGLSWTQRELTRYYARQGFVALSPNYIAEGKRGDRTNALHTKNSLDVEAAVARVIGGAAFLRSLPSVGPDGRVGVMGFCLGGGLALLALARSTAFEAGIVYHQSLFPDVRELQNIQCKIQCHYGTDDSSTPQAEIDAFTAALDRFGKSYELHIYDGMGHSFAQVPPDAELPAPQRAAADLSFTRSFAFFHGELEKAPGPDGARRPEIQRTPDEI